MAKPKGIGRGGGRGLTGLAIMAMANVWLTCVVVPLSLLGSDRDVGRGCGLDGAWPPAVVARLGGDLRGGGLAPLGTRGNAELPGRGLVEFVGCGNVLDRCGKVDMLKIQVRCLQRTVLLLECRP